MIYTIHTSAHVYKQWTEATLVDKLDKISKLKDVETHWVGSDLSSGTKGCLWSLRCCCCNPEDVSGAAALLIKLSPIIKSKGTVQVQQVFESAINNFNELYPEEYLLINLGENRPGIAARANIQPREKPHHLVPRSPLHVNPRPAATFIPVNTSNR